jgi:S-adenosylmethionine/arginine decarboxylase-like enzyme
MATRPALKEAATPWGLLTSLDLYDCHPDTIRDADKIKQYVVELCTLIDMKRFGDCQVVHFGEEERVAGFSMIQLIETSLISGHFANLTNSAYIDVFSCKAYDPDRVAEFTREFFKASFVEVHMQTFRTCWMSVSPRNTFRMPSCMSVVMPPFTASSRILSITALAWIRALTSSDPSRSSTIAVLPLYPLLHFSQPLAL